MYFSGNHSIVGYKIIPIFGTITFIILWESFLENANVLFPKPQIKKKQKAISLPNAK